MDRGDRVAGYEVGYLLYELVRGALEHRLGPCGELHGGDRKAGVGVGKFLVGHEAVPLTLLALWRPISPVVPSIE